MLLHVKPDKISLGWKYTLQGKVVIQEQEMVDAKDYHIARGTDTLVEEKSIKTFLPYLKKEMIEACNNIQYSFNAYVGKNRDKKEFMQMRKFNGIITMTSQDKVLVQFNEVLEFQGEYADFFRELFKRDAIVTAKQITAFVINNMTDNQRKTYHKCTEILLNKYTDIVFYDKDINSCLKVLAYTAKAHYNIQKAIQLDRYPKMNVIRVHGLPKERNNKIRQAFYQKDGVEIFDRYDNDYELMLTYYHEMGHYIHDKLVSNPTTKENNRNVFHKLITELRRTMTVKYIRDKAKLLPTHKNYFKYLLKEEELIARIFATFFLHKYHKNESWYAERSTDMLTFFEEKDIEIFMRNMNNLK